jgi:hypothetical protein
MPRVNGYSAIEEPSTDAVISREFASNLGIRTSLPLLNLNPTTLLLPAVFNT